MRMRRPGGKALAGWRVVRPLAIFLVVAAIAGAAVWGYLSGTDERKGEAPVAAPQRVTMVDGRAVVTLDAAARRDAGIETAKLAAVDFQRRLHGFGSVLELSAMGERARSWAEARARREGARARAAGSATVYKRDQALIADGRSLSLAQLQAAEEAFSSDQAALAEAVEQERAEEQAAGREWGPVLGPALWSARAQGGVAAAELLAGRSVLLRIVLPAGAIGGAAPPRAEARWAGGTAVEIALVSPAPRSDPALQGPAYFYSAPASSGLVPGANVVAELPVGAPQAGVLLPASAVVWWQGRAWVFLETEADRFTRTEIAGDRQTADGRVFAAGLPATADVVVQGAQMLLSEEFRAQIEVGEEERNR